MRCAVSGEIKSPEKAAAAAVDVEGVPGAGRKTDPCGRKERPDS